ncbi:MAG: hypothetical protein ONB17_10780, partial [candidate division KSB1 bacterium]|nr:hypothetical protein [candidate division KSB1 bacterium]
HYVPNRGLQSIAGWLPALSTLPCVNLSGKRILLHHVGMHCGLLFRPLSPQLEQALNHVAGTKHGR